VHDFIEFKNKEKILLNKYINLIKKNQNKVNLIGKSTFSDIWSRHIIDSMQILNYLPKETKEDYLLDVGTGAGFPGLVLAIMGRNDVLLCEKSPKKAVFLKKVLKECNLNADVCNEKIENIIGNNIKIIVSRAFASIKKLLLCINHLLSRQTVLVIHKGRKYQEELKEAKNFFYFTFKKFNSITSDEGVILKIENIKKK
tara:strand:- start:1239 stop:1835 length:597 start_codon:yes stop_codon:yes gene_type:complete